MDQEGVFAEEAQEEVLNRNGLRSVVVDSISDNEVENHENETSPLMSPQQNRRPDRGAYTRASKSYQKAIDEPWTGSHGSSALPWYKTPSVFWLLPAFFPFCVAFGGIIVPKTYLILDLICEKYLSERASKDPNFTYLPILMGEENPQCRTPQVQSRVAQFNLFMNLLSGIFSAIIAPHLGALSDRVGRKKVICCASVGALSNEIITIIVGTYPEKVSVYWILLGALFDGLSGSFTTGMALAFAYASDCSSPERRSVAFGYFHGTLFAGIALGPLLAGYLIKVTGTVLTPFYVALACNVFFILFVAVAVPESLSKERQTIAQEKHAVAKAGTPHKGWLEELRSYNPFEPLWVLRPTGEGASKKLRRNLFILASIDTMMFGVAMGTMQIILIYAEYRHGWTAVVSAMYLSATNVCRVIGLVLLLPLLVRIFRGRTQKQSAGHKGMDLLDINVIRATVLFDLAGYIGYAFAPTTGIMFLSGMFASLGGIGPPTLQSALTQHIPADKTGQVLGASGLLHALARVVAPTVFNLIYSKTVGIYAGIVFICLASIFVVCFVFSWFLKPGVYLPQISSHDTDEDETGNHDD